VREGGGAGGQADLGEENTFYFNESLGRWVERGQVRALEGWGGGGRSHCGSGAGRMAAAPAGRQRRRPDKAPGQDTRAR
jgi:hypothetical protein